MPRPLLALRMRQVSMAIQCACDSKHVVDLDLQFLKTPKYTAARKLALVREVRMRLASLPGVAAISSAHPPGDNFFRTAAASLDREKSSAQDLQSIHYAYVQAIYFQTLGIPLLLGHSVQPGGGPPAHYVILSESAARQFWPGQNPIGRSLRLGATDERFHNWSELSADGPGCQVAGIARDTRGADLNGSDSRQIYLQLPEDRLQDYPLLIRTQSDPAQVVRAIDPLISSIDPDLAATFSTLDDMLRQSPSFIASSLTAGIASTVGLLGLLLASMGIYGTVSYIVALRTREVGIRMAVGAQKRDILGLILRESARPVLAVLLAGMFLAVGASRLLHGLLFGLDTVDGISFAGVSLFVFGHRTACRLPTVAASHARRSHGGAPIRVGSGFPRTARHMNSPLRRPPPASVNMTRVHPEPTGLPGTSQIPASDQARADAWRRVQLARHPKRPHALDYIERVFTDFQEMHGDRLFGDDPAIVCGAAFLGGRPVMVVGEQKGRDTKQKLYRNFGMPKPEGYRKALRVMQLASKFGRPVITLLDTPGAYPGIDAEERGQAEAIARNLREMSRLAVPVIVICIGEGGSGGALALGVGNRVLMLENAIYSVISPESCAAIIWRDSTKAELAAAALKLTAEELLKLGLIDTVVGEPAGGAHEDMDAAARFLSDSLLQALESLSDLGPDQLVEQRYVKFRHMGNFFA